MITNTARVLAVLSAAVFLVCLATAASPTDRDTPNQAAYSHYLRFKVLEVTPVEKTATQNLVKVRVQPWYGKIDQHSYDLHKEHDTQEFSFLFPAAPDTAIKVGDIIDYRIVRYITHDE
jgi:hypothetical protein